MTYAEAISRMYTELSAALKDNDANVDDNDIRADVHFLAEYVSGYNGAELALKSRDEMPEELYLHLQRTIGLRMQHVPLQYITHSQEFMGLDFFVDERVLIPRLDTEILAEMVCGVSKGRKVLDLCTGSGCLAVSIAKLGSPLSVTASDISEQALIIAGGNAERNRVGIEYIQSDMFEKLDSHFDIIVSNPPYITTKEISVLSPEVCEHEPLLALDGSSDGLYFYRIIAAEAGKHLNKDGDLFLEIGCEQGISVTKLLTDAGFSYVRVIKDYAGLDRIVHGKMEQDCL